MSLSPMGPWRCPEGEALVGLVKVQISSNPRGLRYQQMRTWSHFRQWRAYGKSVLEHSLGRHIIISLWARYFTPVLWYMFLLLCFIIIIIIIIFGCVYWCYDSWNILLESLTAFMTWMGSRMLLQNWKNKMLMFDGLWFSEFVRLMAACMYSRVLLWKRALFSDSSYVWRAVYSIPASLQNVHSWWEAIGYYEQTMVRQLTIRSREK